MKTIGDPGGLAAAEDRRFTLYRATIVALWPDSDLKRATMAAILNRMKATGVQPL